MRRDKFISVMIICSILAIGSLSVISGCGRNEVGGKAGQAKIMYHCPMHPTYVSDKQGDCPICGMKLVKTEIKAEARPDVSGKSISVTEGAKEKSLKEVCVEYKCTMKDCPMMIKAHIEPGERLVCPVCGEVIATTSGKVVEIARHTAAPPAERKILFYRNPMNAEVTSPVPMKDQMGMDYIPVYEERQTAGTVGPTITISAEKQQLIGVKTEAVKKMELTKVVRASGKIAYDPELVVTQEEFIQALNNEENVKDSPLQDAIDRARSLTAAARNKLKLLGMSDDQVAGLEKSRKAETNLYLPGKGENVWAYINVYEYEIGLIKIGDHADIEAIAYPGEKFTGTIVSIGPVLDPSTRTNQVRVEVPNPDTRLKPEMFVNALIKESLGSKLAVPETAVLDTGLRKIVYLSEPNDVLESREVTLGQRAENYYEVLSGLSEGDVVVTSGNFLIDSESKLKSP